MASLADLPHITSLREQWSASRGLTGDMDVFAERVRVWWQRRGSSRICWLAFDAELAIGMVNLAVFERMPLVGVQDGRWGYIGNLWVSPGQRRRGVATALMSTVIDWCRAESLERVVLNPSEMSASICRARGFRPADDLLRLDLGKT